MHGSEASRPGEERLRPSRSSAAALLARMQEGDREAVGEFIDRYGERIRRRVRGKLGPAMRRVFDSQEILSTVARRLDEIVREGRLRACEEGQLWSLVQQIAHNAVIDKVRVFERLRRVEGGDEAFAHELLRDLEDADRAGDDGGEVRLERLLRALPDPEDRQILELWLRDVPQVAIARALGMPDGTVRRRWSGIKGRLVPRIEQGMARW